ncbi:hypothetical protein VTO42DRAFT_5424 [Malbranchea cinnamomea]
MSTTAPVQVTELPFRGHFIAQEHHLNARVSPRKATENAVHDISIKPTQDVLLLKGFREKYTLVKNHAVPKILHQDEILVKVIAIGLNPIDWKAPAFSFGVPCLPWINGRDLAGRVIKVSEGCSRVKVGDVVLVPSTDYRDIRKAAFQEYAIATYYNAARIPPTISRSASAALGVAFVTSALALGVPFGLEFSAPVSPTRPRGPNLPKILGETDAETIPADVRDQCFASAEKSQRIKRGDWLAIWGASTTTGYIMLQLAKLCGVRVICVADVARHGAKLLDAGADLLVDRQDTSRAVEIIRGVTGGGQKLRFAIDTVGRETAALLQGVLTASASETDDTSGASDQTPSQSQSPSQAHLLGLTGLPKDEQRDPRIRYHTVPIKIFHSSARVGEALVTWLEELLRTHSLRLPEVVHAEGGLAGINDALERLRNGSVSGKRIVVELEKEIL